MANDTNFGAALGELRERLQWAIDSLEILRVLLPLVPDRIEKRVEKIVDSYSGFFEPTIQAHINQIFVLITVVTEKRGGPNESLNNLLEEMDRHPELAPDLQTPDLRQKLEGVKEVVGRIHRRRHNSIAHLNIKAENRTVFLDEVYSLLQTLKDILDEIYCAHTGKIWNFSAWHTRDARRLVEELWEYRILEPIADRIFQSATQDKVDPSRYYIPSELFEEIDKAFDSFKPLHSG